MHTYIHTYTHIHTYMHTYIHKDRYLYVYTTNLCTNTIFRETRTARQCKMMRNLGHLGHPVREPLAPYASLALFTSLAPPCKWRKWRPVGVIKLTKMTRHLAFHHFSIYCPSKLTKMTHHLAPLKLVRLTKDAQDDECRSAVLDSRHHVLVCMYLFSLFGLFSIVS